MRRVVGWGGGGPKTSDYKLGRGEAYANEPSVRAGGGSRRH